MWIGQDQRAARGPAILWGITILGAIVALAWTLPWHRQPPWVVIAILAFAVLNEIVWVRRLRRPS